jgi:hypothetical protein
MVRASVRVSTGGPSAIEQRMRFGGEPTRRQIERRQGLPRPLRSRRRPTDVLDPVFALSLSTGTVYPLHGPGFARPPLVPRAEADVSTCIGSARGASPFNIMSKRSTTVRAREANVDAAQSKAKALLLELDHGSAPASSTSKLLFQAFEHLVAGAIPPWSGSKPPSEAALNKWQERSKPAFQFAYELGVAGLRERERERQESREALKRFVRSLRDGASRRDSVGVPNASGSATAPAAFPACTPRELEVLRYLLKLAPAECATSDQIGDDLGVEGGNLRAKRGALPELRRKGLIEKGPRGRGWRIVSAQREAVAVALAPVG